MSVMTYNSSKSEFLKFFDRSTYHVRPMLVSRTGEELASSLTKEASQEDEALIPQFPYIGDKSPFVIFLLPTVPSLAVYRALQQHGKPIEDAG